MKTALAIFLGFFTFTSNGQNYVDIARYSYGNNPVNGYDSSEKRKIEELGFQSSFSILLNEKTVILTGFTAYIILYRFHFK